MRKRKPKNRRNGRASRFPPTARVTPPVYPLERDQEINNYLSFPSSAWERTSAKLCFASPRDNFVLDPATSREAELRGHVFPSGAWERGAVRYLSGDRCGQSLRAPVILLACLRP